MKLKTTNKMTTIEMLQRLAIKGSSNVKESAKTILNAPYPQRVIEFEKKYCGGFMKAVLDGDYETAVKRADLDNHKALTE